VDVLTIREQNLTTARQELHNIGLSGKITVHQVEDHLLLMEEIHIEVAKVYKSKLELHYAMEVKKAQIPKGPKLTEHCNTSAEAWIAFRNSVATPTECETMCLGERQIMAWDALWSYERFEVVVSDTWQIGYNKSIMESRVVQ
jgi:hypothetical protein